MALSNIASWTKGGKSSACGTAEKASACGTADVWLTSMECYRDFDKFSKCSRCKLLAWCRGCPAVAKGTNGDFYADDPQCWASEENGLLRSVDK